MRAFQSPGSAGPIHPADLFLVSSQSSFPTDKCLASYGNSSLPLEFLSGSWEKTWAPRGTSSGLEGGRHLGTAGARLTAEVVTV